MRFSVRPFPWAVLVVFALGACGQKGPLYLPDRQADSESPAEAKSENPDVAPKSDPSASGSAPAKTAE